MLEYIVGKYEKWSVCHIYIYITNSLSKLFLFSAARFSTSSYSSMDTQYDEKIQQFLQAIHELCVDEALVKGSQRDGKVTDFRHPKELDVRMNE